MILLRDILIVLVIASFTNCQSLVADGARIERLASNFGFTEGPSADREGNVYFTDQPSNRILKWSAADGSITVLTENSGRANGMIVSNNGSLLTCSDLNNELWSIDVETGKSTVLVTDFEGKKLNGPNDVWEDHSGGIYFTDPLYVRDYWTRDPATQQSCEGVYFLPPGQKAPIRVVSDLKKPNGLVGTPDGLYLYIADIDADRTYRYDIRPDGSLTNKQLFTEKGSDGMTIDELGNVYLVRDGLTIFDSNGKQIERIPITASWTANLCFGGSDFRTLFITASQYLYSVRMRVRGVRWG